jgi:hypothetical protein
MNFANVTDWTIPEGTVNRVTDSLGNIIWQRQGSPYYITAVYYPITDTSTTHILYDTSGVTSIVYEGTEYTPRAYLKFSQKLSNQVVTIYLNSPSVDVSTLFKDVDRVKAITVGKNITNITKSSIVYGSYLWYRTANVENGNPVYDSRGNGIVNTATNTLVVGCSGTTFDSTVTTIGSYAFANVARGNDGAQISESDTSMPNNGVVLWEIPRTVTTIEEHAFLYTRKISKLYVRGPLIHSQNIPTNAFIFFGDNTSQIHIPTGGSFVGTVWKSELVDNRSTGYKWTMCADL